MEKILPVLIVIAFLLVLGLLFVLAIRWARKSSKRGAVLGWGVQLMGAGMDPLPPPQIQIDEATRQARLKKQSESGDPED
jgi:hypothetical protein